MNKKIRIGIISDLHCHPEKSNHKENATYLFTDKLRDSIFEHPIESFKNLIELEKIAPVDIVLCPGDFTNQSDKQGLISGWNYVIEFAEILGTNKIYGTLGNHDIDSRNKFSSYSFKFPRAIRKNFPINENEITTFWDKGFCFIEMDLARLLIINTTHFHTHTPLSASDENPNVKGKIEQSGINEISEYLKNNNDNKISLMLCHHHPIQHSEMGLGAYDFVENGDELINELGKFSFDLVIHGHKHNPQFREYKTTDGHQIPILSSGSFSATDQIIFCSKYNYFHIVEIEKEETISKGEVNTWSFKNRIGWSKNNHGFIPSFGFGVKDTIENIIQEIKKKIPTNTPTDWIQLLATVPIIKNLNPYQLQQLNEILDSSGIIISPSILDNPKKILIYE